MENVVFQKPECMSERPFHYCPGCSHGIVHRMVGELIDEMGLKDKTVGVAPVGCGVFAYWYFDFDFTQAPHGRAPAVATGIKRPNPDLFVFTYQGDGDLAAIGTAEIVHAANRSENITVIFINNAIYGMTGGQMAPTTLIGQKSTTSPYGRDEKTMGKPIRVCEMLSTLEGTTYAERVQVGDPKGVIATKKALKKAFEVQVNKQGFSIIEILSTCPTNWGMSAVDATTWMKENMLPYYPLGVYADKTKQGGEA